LFPDPSLPRIELEKQDRVLTWVKVPSHVGIEGNIGADRLTKIGYPALSILMTPQAVPSHRVVCNLHRRNVKFALRTHFHFIIGRS